jgi:hypothetical protein
LTLCRNGSAGYTTDDCASCCPSTAAYCAANDCPGSAAQDRAAYRILCGRILYRYRQAMARKAEVPKARYIFPSLLRQKTSFNEMR